MSKINCLNILRDIKKSANEIRFSNDSRLKELFQMTIDGDKDRLKSAESRYDEIVRDHEVWVATQDNAMLEFSSVKQDLEAARQKCEQLKSGVISSSTSHSVKRLEEQIESYKDLLKFYKEVTGVRFVFNSPEDVVCGYVAIKGKIPSHSKMQPFILKKTKRIPDEIWEKVSEAVENVPIMSVSQQADFI